MNILLALAPDNGPRLWQAEFFQDVHFITIYRIKQIFVHKRREPESSRFYLGE